MINWLKRVNRKVASVSMATILVISSLSIAFPMFVQQNVGAISSVFPSTNAQNIINGWANVVQTGGTSNSVLLDFSSTRGFYSCFEYRTDGDISQKLDGRDNYNSEITDGLYPYFCINNSSRQEMITASGYVEVRLSFGAEKDERFDWTRFNVINTDETQFVGSPKYVRENNGGDLAAQIVTPDETSDVRFFVDGDMTNPISGNNIGGAGATTSWWRLYVPLPAGEHQISVEVQLYGNWYPVSSTGVVYSLDLPTAEYIIPQVNQVFRSNDRVVRVKAEDEFDQFKRMVTKIDGVSYEVLRSECSDKGSYVLCDLSNLNLAEGDYIATTTTYTKANNRVDNMISYQFSIDNTAPTVTDMIIENTTSGIVSDSIVVSAKASDNRSIESVNFYITSPRSDGVCTGNGVKLAKLRQLTVSSDGRYRAILDVTGLNGNYCVTAVSRDDAKNNSSPISQGIIIDTVSPVVNLTGAVDGGAYNTDVTLIGTVTDDNPHHYWLKIVKDGIALNISGVTGTRSATGFNTTLTEEGDYEITFAARDAAGGGSNTGNRSDNLIINFTIDKTGPANLEIDGGYDQTFDTNLLTISGTVDTDADHMEYYIDGGSAQNITNLSSGVWSFIETLIDGDYIIVVRAYDILGNYTEKTLNLTVDTPDELNAGGVVQGLTTTNVATTQTSGASDQSGDVNGTTDNTDSKEDGEVLAEEDENNGDAEAEKTNGIFGLAWYWWILIALAIVALWKAIAGKRDNDKK